MPRSYFTIGFLLSFLAVSAGLRFLQLPAYPKKVWVALGVFGIAALLWELITQRFQYTIQLNSIVGRGGGFFFLCIIVGSSLAFLRVAQTTHPAPDVVRRCGASVSCPDFVEKYAVDCGGMDCREVARDASPITLRGRISDEPDRRPLKTRYTVEVSEIDRQEVSGKILVTDYAAWPRHSYGDEVRVSGVLERPGMIEDFAYDRYLSRFGIYAIMPRAQVETIASGSKNSFFAVLYTLKERFERQINRLYPEPHAAFLAGLLTGSRQGIPEHLLEDFQATGLTHIIAISGYNITIVLTIIGGFLFFLPLKWRFLPSLLAITFFTLFVGGSPSVVRAAIMGALGLLALQTSRQKHSLIAILFTATLMVALNPKLLWYDAGFQLSFLAVLGITYLSPFLEHVLKFVPEGFLVRESLKTTLAAQLAAVPLVTLLFGQFSLVAPLANVAVALLIPFAMLVGFLGVIMSFLSFPLGLAISYLSFGALELIISIAETLADLPYASLHVSPGNHLWVLGYYVLLVIGVSMSAFFIRRRNTGILE